MFPPSMPSGLIQTIWLSHTRTLCVVTKLANLCARRILIFKLPAALELNQLRSYRTASSTQLVQPGMSMMSRLTKARSFVLFPGKLVFLVDKWFFRHFSKPITTQKYGCDYEIEPLQTHIHYVLYGLPRENYHLAIINNTRYLLL